MPSWIPLCKTMQKYCEPYFAAIDDWRRYEDTQLLSNRLQLIEAAHRILAEFSPVKEKSYRFNIVYELEEVELKEEVMPSCGKNYIPQGDTQAFNSAKSLVPVDIFNKTGVFFQTNLLKAMAGWNESYLALANEVTRASVIDSIERLFRIPPIAGLGKFMYAELEDDNSTVKGSFHEFTNSPLSELGQQLQTLLHDSTFPPAVSEQPSKKDKETPAKRKSKGSDAKDEVKSSPKKAKVTSSAEKKKATAAKKEKASATSRQTNRKKKPNRNYNSDEEEVAVIEIEEQDEEVPWTTNHQSIGTKVAAHFDTQKKPFKGEVVKYAPPSKPGENDQLFHIQWEDDDEQDYDEKDLKIGIDLYKQLESWTVEHPSINTPVAAFFGDPLTKQMKMFQGKVTQFCPPSTAGNDQLYHVEWEDGDEEDYEEAQFLRAKRLHEEKFDHTPVAWTTEHPSVQAKVATYEKDVATGRRKSGNKKPVKKFSPKHVLGRVMKFGDGSSIGLSERLYQVKWEDGDTEELDENQFQEALALYCTVVPEYALLENINASSPSPKAKENNNEASSEISASAAVQVHTGEINYDDAFGEHAAVAKENHQEKMEVEQASQHTSTKEHAHNGEDLEVTLEEVQQLNEEPIIHVEVVQENDS